jgi:cysteine dioxygenase
MMQALDVHPLKSRVGDFIADLQAMEKDPISAPRVLDLLSQTQLGAEAFSPYLLWNSKSYARNLIYRDRCFEVLALCWLPGQRTPIHSHNGQMGWVKVVQGEITCRNYRFVRSPEATRTTGTDRDAALRNRRVEVELLGSAHCQADGSVAGVDRCRTTHQIENLEKSGYGSVSLHVYSKPIDSCVLFDETTRSWERRRLKYYSAEGFLLDEAA